jgi:8-hydroxy-5-deazaflavin:NADPH oxidoreductase
MSDESLLVRIAVLGGTGKEGKGLAYRWAKAGYQVLIGSAFTGQSRDHRI